MNKVKMLTVVPTTLAVQLMQKKAYYGLQYSSTD